MKKHHLLGQVVALASMILVLFGCARGKDFTIAENEKAPQTGQYPEFNKPVAAFNQFTEEDKTRLTSMLAQDKQMVEKEASSVPANTGVKTETVDDVRRETEDVLRQIEQSRGPEPEQDDAQKPEENSPSQ